MTYHLPYLAAEAATLGDKELPPRHRPLTTPVLQEMEYASDLFRRAEKAIKAEVEILRTQDVSIDWAAVSQACFVLMSTAVALHLRARVEHESMAVCS